MKAYKVFSLLMIAGMSASLLVGCQNEKPVAEESGAEQIHETTQLPVEELAEEPSDEMEGVVISGRYISDIYPDMGRYDPDDVAKVKLELYNLGVTELKGELKLKLTHIGETVQERVVEIQIAPNEWLTERESFLMPEDDFTGYALEAYLYDNGTLVDYEMTALDVSSDWSMFPRYGYLADSFDVCSYNESYEVLEELLKYHINGLFYFDVVDRHDTPLAGTVDEPAETYQNLAKKTISKKTLQNLLKIGREMNMKNYLYNLMFGAYEDYEKRGISPEWGMYIDGKEQDSHPLPASWESRSLKLFNPANPGWQDYYIKTHKDYLDVYRFDGIQVDSLGSRAYLGQTTDYKGEPFSLGLSYSTMLNRLKEEADTDIIFNAVSGYGQDDVLEKVPDYDIIFAEIWPESYPTYGSIKKLSDKYYAITGGTKGHVMPAYVNMPMVQKAHYFNEPGVRYANSVIVATGGSHLEMGDCGMLHTTYYPDQYFEMTQSLERATRNMYSFMTAYENVLRGEGLKEVETTTIVGQEETTSYGGPEAVWAFTKEKESTGQEILHLINLKNVEDTEWVDADMKQAAPPVMKDVKVKHYVNGVKQVFAASPDYQEGIMKEVSFEAGTDKTGDYVEFELPYLEYYTMIVLEK